LKEDFMRKLLLGLAASTALFAAGAASAAINMSYWVDQGPGSSVDAAENATLANVSVATLGAPSGTGAVAALKFSTDDSTVTTVDEWLGISTGANGGHALNNTVFLFTGSTFLAAGDNSFVVPHDDGLQLNIDGIGLVVDAPGPTAEDFTAFNVNAPAAGFYKFELSYGECCGGPAVIEFDVNGGPAGTSGGVPEPATWAMMLMGFGGLGALVRRRRTVALAA
jgi:PEP-CTERM motif-containing protein